MTQKIKQSAYKYQYTGLIKDPVITASLPHKYLSILGMLWVTCLIVSVFTTLKTFAVYGFVFSVAVIAYPFVYIFADIFTEVYGYRVTRKIVWTGFVCMLLATSLACLYTYVPSKDFQYNDAFNAMFRVAPLVALGAILAAFLGELTNSFIVAKMKLLTQDRWVHSRLVISTFFGQTVDNSLYFLTAFCFTNWFNVKDIIPLLISTVTFCTTWEIIALPITRKVINTLKQKEGIDTYDYGTKFNPFKF